MMETRIPLDKAQTCLDDLLRRVEGGERIVITHAGRDVAQLQSTGARPAENAGESDTLPSLDEWRSSIEVRGTALSATIREQREEDRS